MTAAELKASILDRAVHGLLVPQREEERFEKFEGFERFEKSTIDNPPYELPRGWVWKRLGDLVDYGSCENAESKDIAPNAWVLDLEEIEKDTGRLLVRARAKDKKVKSTKHIFKKGMVLYSKLRTYLNKVLVADEDGFCTSEIIPLPFPSYTDPEFARRVLMSPMFLAYAESKGYGQKMPRFGSSDAKKAPFPLPPLAEQKRIVAKIEELMPLVEEYGKAETELAALNDNFPTALRKSILQHAVEGRLTAAWRRARFEKFERFEGFEKSETAAQLLDEIAAEKKHLLASGKIKKQKPLPPITDDEKPFPIPDGWAWVRLNDIFNFIDYRGKTPTKIDSGVPLVTAKNVRQGYMDYSVKDFISEEEFADRQSRGVSKKGDILFTTEAPLGFAAIADIDRFSSGQRLITFQQYTESSLLVNLAFMYFILAPGWQKYLYSKRTGTTVAGIKAEFLKELILPLPPLAEQKAIVERVEELLGLVEKMK